MLGTSTPFYSTSNTERKSCPVCRRSMLAKWPFCVTCDKKLPADMRKDLMDRWRNRNDGPVGGNVYQVTFMRCYEYLKGLEDK